jgi:predicted negative regulator of RcsB-dependent stress response
LQRIHGALLLQLGQREDAKAAFTTGLQIAQEQGASWWAQRCQHALALVAVGQ